MVQAPYHVSPIPVSDVNLLHQSHWIYYNREPIQYQPLQTQQKPILLGKRKFPNNNNSN